MLFAMQKCCNTWCMCVWGADTSSITAFQRSLLLMVYYGICVFHTNSMHRNAIIPQRLHSTGMTVYVQIKSTLWILYVWMYWCYLYNNLYNIGNQNGIISSFFSLLLLLLLPTGVVPHTYNLHTAHQCAMEVWFSYLILMAVQMK